MNPQPHLDAGARALHALPDSEAASFDRHLGDCPVCSEEYGEFAETVALLGAAVAVEPPASLHRSLMARIDRTVQTPPAGSPSDGEMSDADEPGSSGSPKPANSQSALPTTSRRPWFRRTPGLLAAAVVALALVAGGIVVAVVGDESVPPTARACVEQASDARVITPDVGAGGTVRYAPSCGAAVVRTPTMPDLPADRGYQLWVMAGDRASSAGMVPAGARNASLVVPIEEGDTDIGVSVEPADGSPAPTTDPIWVVPLSG